MKFRKKPVVIEAYKVRDPLDDDTFPTPQWLLAGITSGTVNAYTDGHVEITTLEGVMRADVGDWIIQGVKGELYPCKPDIFEATYEPVESV